MKKLCMDTEQYFATIRNILMPFVVFTYTIILDVEDYLKGFQCRLDSTNKSTF